MRPRQHPSSSYNSYNTHQDYISKIFYKLYHDIFSKIRKYFTGIKIFSPKSKSQPPGLEMLISVSQYGYIRYFTIDKESVSLIPETPASTSYVVSGAVKFSLLTFSLVVTLTSERVNYSSLHSVVNKMFIINNRTVLFLLLMFLLDIVR